MIEPRHPRLPRLLLSCLVAGAAGCSSIDGGPGTVVIPSQQLNVSRSLQIPAETIGAGAALYFVIDPLAPNWRVEEEQLGPDLFRIGLRKKRFTTGGDGEAMQVLTRRAEKLAREKGYGGYRVVQYHEAIESLMPIAQRVSWGTVRLVRTP